VPCLALVTVISASRCRVSSFTFKLMLRLLHPPVFFSSFSDISQRHLGPRTQTHRAMDGSTMRRKWLTSDGELGRST
jgi:hypothetical protein